MWYRRFCLPCATTPNSRGFSVSYCEFFAGGSGYEEYNWWTCIQFNADQAAFKVF